MHRYGDIGPTTFLSADEMHELTGYQVARCQIIWLRHRRWRFETNAAGMPKVARAYFERRMVGEVEAPEPALRARHNFEALGKAAGPQLPGVK